MIWQPKPSYYKHPADPERDPDYDADADYEAYLNACDERYERSREDRYS